MFKIPRPIAKLIESFEKLPGIGPKTAQRLTYYLLHVPQEELDDFSDSLRGLKSKTILCSICKNVGESDPCPICIDPSRNHSLIMVVEAPLDILAFERTNKYQGVYHVLHGAISPLDNIGPDEIFIAELFKRLGGNGKKVEELIIATNPTMEGEATSMYIKKEIDKRGINLKVSRLGVGIPTGADLEYIDATTLTQAIYGRREI